MAAALGCGDLSAAYELSCMQKVDALKIQAYVLEYGGGGFGGIGGMVADNVTAFANNTQRLAEGKVAKIVSNALSLILPKTDTCDSL
jgi:hypothetical protein